MADKYPGISLGDALDESQRVITIHKCVAAITKGQVVQFHTDVPGDMPAVDVAGADCPDAIGVALQTGAIGQYIKVLRKGIVKVTDSGAGVTGGTRVKCGALGTVATAEVDTVAHLILSIGRAVQTLGAGDTGLIDFGAP